MLKQFFFFLTFLSFFLATTFAQKTAGASKNTKNVKSQAKATETFIRSIDLNTEKPSWLAVAAGAVVSPVVETSYGLALITDGRTVNTITYNGNTLFNKNIKGSPSRFVTAMGDFVYTVVDGKKLTLINPSGLILWQSECGFSIEDNPLCGLDGRVFVKGRENIACFGLDGRRKWQIKTPPLLENPLLFLNDGSIIALLKELSDGKSTAFRISAFGETIELLTFSGQVLSAASCKQGVMLALKGGTFGMCSADKDSGSVSTWVKTASAARNIQIVCPAQNGKTAALFTQNGANTDVVIASCQDGQVLTALSAGKINLSQVTAVRSTENGYFIADTSRAVEFSEDGDIIWEASLPQKNNWTYLTYTSKNQLVLCMNTWLLKSYLMSQSVHKKSQPVKYQSFSYVKADHKESEKIEGLSIRSLDEDSMRRMLSDFQKDDIGKKEEEYMVKITTEAENFVGDYMKEDRLGRGNISYFTTHPVYSQLLISLMAGCGSGNFASSFASLLHNESDRNMIIYLIKGAAALGYDPDGSMLEALDYIIVHRLSQKDVTEAREICDAVYSICRFMGRPALFKHGKEMLSTLLYPQWDKQIRDYARVTLTNIVKLEL